MIDDADSAACVDWRERILLMEVGEMTTVYGMFWRIWDIAREVLGDKAYERYAEAVHRQGEEPQAPGEFYLAQLQSKYSRPSRCC